MLFVDDSCQHWVRICAMGHGVAHSGTHISTHTCVCWGGWWGWQPHLQIPSSGLILPDVAVCVCACMCANTRGGVFPRTATCHGYHDPPTPNPHAFEIFTL